MQVVIVGQVCIDKNVSENAEYTAAGGPPIFMDKVFSQIPDVTLTTIAPYGKDFLPFAPQLPLYPAIPTTDQTLVYENVTKGTVRQQKAYHRKNAAPIQVDEEVKKILGNCDVLFITPLLPNFTPEYLQDIVTYTKKDTLKVLLPQGYYRGFDSNNNMVVQAFDQADKILPLFDIVIVSEVDGEEMLTTAEDWSEEYRITSIVTLGENGAVAIKDNKNTYLSTTPVAAEKIIDSVGSGEIFSASLAYGYKKTGDLEKAGKFANAVAKSCLFYTPDEIQINLALLQMLD